MSTLASPLNKLLAKDTPWCWSEEWAKSQSFQDLKDTLTSSRVLAPYNLKLEVQLAVNASPFGLEVVISHITDGRGGASNRSRLAIIDPAEKNYYLIEKEVLAIIIEICKIPTALEWSLFHVVHRPPTLTVEEGCLLMGTQVVILAKYQESVLAELQ